MPDDQSPIIEPMSEEMEALACDLEATPEDRACDLMDVFRYQIGRRLKEWGWTQADLAEAMGVKPPTVSRLLNSDNATLLSLAKAAWALDLVPTVVKFVPEEELGEQVDELKAFVRSERHGAGWWPITRKRSSHLHKRMSEFTERSSAPGFWAMVSASPEASQAPLAVSPPGQSDADRRLSRRDEAGQEGAYGASYDMAA